MSHYNFKPLNNVVILLHINMTIQTCLEKGINVECTPN
jgi:hypothetical protein